MNIPDDPIGDALLALLAQTVTTEPHEPAAPDKTLTLAVHANSRETRTPARRIPVHLGERVLR